MNFDCLRMNFKFTFSILLFFVFATLKVQAQTDTLPPVITLIGKQVYTVDLVCSGGYYTDMGATAYDSTEGDITSNMVMFTNVDINHPGEYYVLYQVQDRSGNFSSIKRTVIVSPPKPHGFKKEHISGDLYMYYTNRSFESTRKQYAWYIDGVKLDPNKSKDSIYIFHDDSSKNFVSMEEWFCAGDTSMFFRIIDSSNSSKNISGKVYLDRNDNCAIDGSDISASIPVILYNAAMQPIQTNMSEDGQYFFSNLDSGKYFVAPDNTFKSLDYCEKQAKEVITIATDNNGFNFMVQCNSNASIDPRVGFINGQNMRPGLTASIQSQIMIHEYLLKNLCQNSALSAKIDIEFNGKIKYLKPEKNALTPSSVNGLHFTYNISNLYDIKPNSLVLLFDVDTTATITDTVIAKIKISQLSNDADTSNNELTVRIPIRNSYDPNLVEIQPYEVYENYDHPITHTIHFQNTGNDVAFNIRVRDTLDNLLDPESFELLYSSHPLTYAIKGTALSFYLKDINLADSFSDEKASHGQIVFRVKPKSKLTLNDEVTNRAFIYFDYNPPVITNTALLEVKDIIDPGSSINTPKNQQTLSIYPNPSHEQFTINYLSNNETATIEIYDVYGQLIAQYQPNDAQQKVNTQSWSRGVYVVILKVGGKQVVGRVVVE